MSLVDSMEDRRFISRYAIEPVALAVRISGAPANADGNNVTVRLETIASTPVVIFSRSADHTGVGIYETLMSSAETSTPGMYQVVWTYSISSSAQTFAGLLEIGESSAAYDALEVGYKGVIESVYIRFADLFDSPDGGPHLQVYFQTKFGRGRMAQLLGIALGRMNTIAQPHMTYTLDGNTFPIAQWGPLLEAMLYIETLKHLIRTYTEQPDAVGLVTARLDRRDYMDRWKTVLEMEQKDLTLQMEGFKIAHMGLGRPRVLVSGGVYGRYGPTRLPGNPAQPRSWARHY